ncbi:MAG: PKD domain-containing protein [Candidatus Caldarchaeum sp.]
MRRNKQTIAIILGMLLAIPLGLFIIPRMFAVLLSAGPVQVTVDSPDPLPSSLPYGQSITLSGRLINTGGSTGMSVFGMESNLVKPFRVVPIPDGDFQLSREIAKPISAPIIPSQPSKTPTLPMPSKPSGQLPAPIPVVTTTAAKTAVSPQTAVATTKTTIATATTTTATSIQISLNVVQRQSTGRILVSVDGRITGGTPPYTVTVEFGDGARDQKSVGYPYQFAFDHFYERPGTYTISVTAMDSKGVSARRDQRIVLSGQGVLTSNYCIVQPLEQHSFVLEYARSLGLVDCETGSLGFSPSQPIPDNVVYASLSIGREEKFRGVLSGSVNWRHTYNPSYWGDNAVNFYVEYCSISIRKTPIASRNVTQLSFSGSCSSKGASVSFQLLFGKIVDVVYPSSLPHNRTPGSSYPLSFGVVNLAGKPLSYRVSTPSTNVGIDTGTFTLSPGEKRTFSYNIPAHHLLSGFTLALEAYDGGSRIGALWIDQVNVKSSDQPNPWIHPQVTVTINGRVKPYGENYRPASGTVVKIWWEEEERGATTFTRKELTLTPGNDGSFSKTITMNFMAANGGVKSEMILHMDIMPNQYYESEGGAHVTIYNVNGASQTISPTIYVRKAGGGVITAPSIFQPQISALIKSHRVLPPGWTSAEVTLEITVINQGSGSGSGRVIVSHATIGMSPPVNYMSVNTEISLGPHERKTLEATAVVGVTTSTSGGVRGAVGVSFLYVEPESGVQRELRQLLTFESSPGSVGTSTSINPPSTTSSGAVSTSSGRISPGDRNVNTPSGSQIKPTVFTEDRTTASYQLTAQGDKATAIFDFGQTAPSTIGQTPSGGISATGTAVFSATREPAKNILQQIVDAILGFFRWLDEILFGWMK